MARIFVSYSHQDRAWKSRVVSYIDAADLDTWDDDDIEVGADWFGRIRGAIGAADAAVLLISPDFLRSKFVREHEMPRLLGERSNRGMKIFPIIVRPSPLEPHVWLREMQVRPRDLEPLSAMTDVDADKVLAEFASEVQSLVRTNVSMAAVSVDDVEPWWPDGVPLPRRPYPLLEPYRSPELYAGRTHEIDAFASAVREPKLVTPLYGSSGVGKSSFINCGLAPRLRGDADDRQSAVAVERTPGAPGLLNRLLVGVLRTPLEPKVGDRDVVRFLSTVERLRQKTGYPPVFILDQFEDAFKGDESALARIGPVLGHTAVQGDQQFQFVCRWVLSYREEFHGAVEQWLADYLRPARMSEVLGIDNLPTSLLTPEFYNRTVAGLRPMATPLPPLAGDAAMEWVTDRFVEAIGRPLEARREDGTMAFHLKIAGDGLRRLAAAFARERVAHPRAPLTTELQVVLDALLQGVSWTDDRTVQLTSDLDACIEGALERHLERKLREAFQADDHPQQMRTRGLLVLLRLADEAGASAPVPVEELESYLGSEGAAVLDGLARSDVRLIMKQRHDLTAVYALPHDRLASVVRRVGQEPHTRARYGLDDELLRTQELVASLVALHRKARDLPEEEEKLRHQACDLSADVRKSVERYAPFLVVGEDACLWWADVKAFQIRALARALRNRRIKVLVGLVVTVVAISGIAILYASVYHGFRRAIWDANSYQSAVKARERFRVLPLAGEQADSSFRDYLLGKAARIALTGDTLAAGLVRQEALKLAPDEVVERRDNPWLIHLRERPIAVRMSPHGVFVAIRLRSGLEVWEVASEGVRHYAHYPSSRSISLFAVDDAGRLVLPGSKPNTVRYREHVVPIPEWAVDIWVDWRSEDRLWVSEDLGPNLCLNRIDIVSGAELERRLVGRRAAEARKTIEEKVKLARLPCPERSGVEFVDLGDQSIGGGSESVSDSGVLDCVERGCVHALMPRCLEFRPDSESGTHGGASFIGPVGMTSDGMAALLRAPTSSGSASYELIVADVRRRRILPDRALGVRVDRNEVASWVESLRLDELPPAYREFHIALGGALFSFAAHRLHRTEIASAKIQFGNAVEDANSLAILGRRGFSVCRVSGGCLPNVELPRMHKIVVPLSNARTLALSASDEAHRWYLLDGLDDTKTELTAVSDLGMFDLPFVLAPDRILTRNIYDYKISIRTAGGKVLCSLPIEERAKVALGPQRRHMLAYTESSTLLHYDLDQCTGTTIRVPGPKEPFGEQVVAFDPTEGWALLVLSDKRLYFRLSLGEIRLRDVRPNGFRSLERGRRGAQGASWLDRIDTWDRVPSSPRLTFEERVGYRLDPETRTIDPIGTVVPLD
ncbi:MAG: toll/interleukin-1 receptor domain-containing protein [Deltaproteobacteria bacterium]|jgi:hypothetical protein